MSSQPSSAEKPQRVVLFGGQGSPTVFSAETASASGEIIKGSTTAAALLSRCHLAFLEELADVDRHIPGGLGIEAGLFNDIKNLLSPPPRYQKHGVIQGTTLLLHQLLHYLADIERSGADFTAAFDSLLEASGLCSGLLPAVVISCSTSHQAFVKNGAEAFRLAFWIGCRASVASQAKFNDLPGQLPSSVAVAGLSVKELEEKLQVFHTASGERTTRIACIINPTLLSVTGLHGDLNGFLPTLDSGVTSKAIHVYGWYHGGPRLESVVADVAGDITRRGIVFPDFTDLSKPLRCTLDGAILDPSNCSSSTLAQWISRQLLVNHVDWVETSRRLLQMTHDFLQNQESSQVQIVSFGPSSSTLLAQVRSGVPHPRCEFLDSTRFRNAQQLKPPPATGGDIAIVGMSVNLPGGSGLEKLWETLSTGLSAVSEACNLIPESRFDLSQYYSDHDLSDSRTMPIRHGAFLDDIWTFDNAFFNISPREALSMDPQQRLLLHATQAALDDAGYVPDSSPSFQRSSTGCYVGLATGDYTENLRNAIDVYYSPGTLRAFHSGRISYVYKLSGPSIVTDTACSSSTTAIYQACRALQNGDCTTALAGGVNAICSPDMYLGLARGHFLSPTGACKPFDEAADGYCRAEGCVMFVLKRLPDALRENDRVLGVIKDVVVNQSGNAHSITHPHSDTQIALLEQMLQRTQIDPASIGVIEAHGTGTQAGDTREMATLSTVFGPGRTASNPLLISSIKGNIGHCEAASGAAGLAKLLIMLQKGKVPLQAGLRTLNARITGLDSKNLVIPRETTPWSQYHQDPRRAILNNFGAAGSNTALLLEEPAAAPSRPFQCQPSRSAYVFSLSAKSVPALQESVLLHRQFLELEQTEVSLRDVCYTATARRCMYDTRISVACRSIEDLKQRLQNTDLREISEMDRPKTPIFVFSGQGASHRGMGRELLETCPTFREWVLKCDMILQRFAVPSVLDYLSTEPTSDDPDEQDVCLIQCACVTLEYALAKLLISWGLMPSHVIGHSLGEYAALAVSGVLGLEDTLRVVALRARLMAEQCRQGASGMLACKISASEGNLLIGGNSELSGLAIACMNSPDDCVVAGSAERLSKLEELCTQRDIKAKRLHVPYGFHSAVMDPIMQQLEEIGRSVSWSEPTILTVSTLTGAFWDKTLHSFDYFAQHARRPVQFSDGVEALRTQGAFDSGFVLEIGPHPISLPMVKAILGSASCECIPTLNMNKPAWTSISASLAQVCLLTNEVDWRNVFEASGATLISLPGYPLKGTSFAVHYEESPKEKQEREAGSEDYDSTGHFLLPWLENQRQLDSTFSFKTSMAILGPMADGHKVGTSALCPASVFVELALEAARSCLDCSQEHFVAVEELRFQNPLVHVSSDDCRPVYVLVTRNTTKSAAEFWITVEDTSSNRDKLCCSGNLARRNKGDTKMQWKKDAMMVKRQSSYLLNKSSADVSTFHTKVLYEAVFARVVEYSKEYQSLISLHVSTTGSEGIGTFRMPSTTVAIGCVTSHVFTDTLLHAAGFIANLVVKRSAACICAYVESVSILYDDIDYSETFTVYCSLFDVIEGSILADAFALDADGRTVAILRGIDFKIIGLSSFQKIVRTGITAPAAELQEDLNESSDATSPSPQTASTPATSSGSKSPAEDRATPNHQDVVKNLLTLLGEITSLTTHDLDLNSPLSSLGVDSLMRIELAGKLRRVFAGHTMNYDQVAEMDTIQAMIKEVSSALDASAQCTTPQRLNSTPSPKASIASSQKPVPESVASTSVTDIERTPAFVPLQTSGEGSTKLHVFHDGSGQVAYYKRLEDLGRSIYGLVDPYYSIAGPRHASLVDMAADYVSKLEQSSKEPFLLGGWSFGGVVAFEAGRQLVQKGTKVQGIILIDTPYPVNHQPLHQSIINHAVKSGSPNNGLSSAMKETLMHEFKYHAALLAAHHQHSPATHKSAQGPRLKTVILHSEATLDVQKLCGVRYDWLSSQAHRKQAVENWKTFDHCEVVDVLPIPGNHFEAFMPENIPTISKQLRRACKILDTAG